MTIGVRFPDGPFDPAARIQHAVDAALTGYQGKLDSRMRALLDTGIAVERISIVALSSCAKCRGTGIITLVGEGDWKQQPTMEAKIIVTVAECPTCPGLSVDGKPTSRMGER